MYKALHPRNYVDRLYVSRKEGGRGLVSSEDSVDASIKRLEDNTEKRGGRLITTTRGPTERKLPKKQKLEEKQLYGRFKRLISDISHEKMWTRLRKGNLKRRTESLQIAAQSNAIRTNHSKARIDKKQQNIKFKLCGDRDETINHNISECRKLAQKDYKTSHDWMGKVIHWELCKKFKFNHTDKWYMHNPESVLVNGTLWRFCGTEGSPNLGRTTNPSNNKF